MENNGKEPPADTSPLPDKQPDEKPEEGKTSDDAHKSGTTDIRDILRRVQNRLENEAPRPKSLPEERVVQPKAADRAVMNQPVDREKRRLLRRVHAHLLKAHVGLGAQHETIDLIEVLYHPTNSSPNLNYMTPRQKTAWVPTAQVEYGIEYMQEKKRTPRVLYIEGLLPPLFARTLDSLDLEVESETPVMVYVPGGVSGKPAPVIEAPQSPDDVHVQIVDDQQGIEVWWYVWRNAYYDVLTLGVEPLFVGRDMAALTLGKHIDIVAYKDSFPFGVARVTVQDKTAHLVGTAIFSEMRTPEMTKLLVQKAAYIALERGCTLIFAPGETEADREMTRSLGFVDFGSIVCYAAKADDTNGDTHDNKLAQPILDLR